MSDLKQLAAMTSLNSMFQKGYFDICTVDSVGKMLSINPKGDAYDVLRTLHCIHFEKMPKELRDQVPELIRQCLDVEPTFQFPLAEVTERALSVVASNPATEKRGLLRRLLP